MNHLFSPFEVKASSDDDGTFTGYGSTFGNVDSYGDTVAKGAFSKSIADAKSGAAPWPVMLSQHDSHTPIGVWTDMSENDKGLRLQGQLAVKTRRGLEAYNLLKMKPRPALNGLSIGYRVRDAELHRTGPIKRTLKAIDLVECSLVTFPADKFARVASVKAWLEDEPEPVDENAWKQSAWEDFEKLRRLSQCGRD